MSYESIAELVYDLVKNPKSILSRENWLPSTELNSNTEFTIIKKVFSEYEVSGDVVRLGTLPLGFWG